jgi:uncharacterized protein
MKFSDRNALCSCGSGKKYKYCCQDKNPVEITEHIEAELLGLKQDFLRFSMENYQEQIDLCIDECLADVVIEADETFNQAASLLMVWIIFSLPIAENKQTILQTYINKHGKNIKKLALQKVLHSWDGLAPSIYKVLNDSNDTIYVEDIFTLEKKTIYTFGLRGVFFSERSLEDCYIIGTVIDYHNRSLFFMTFQVIEDNSKIEEILGSYNLSADEFEFSPSRFLIEAFPEIIEIIYNELFTGTFDLDEIDWDTKQQEQVIELVIDNLKLPREVQMMIEPLAATLWKIYCTKTGANIRTVPKYAAGLHYLVSYFYLFFGGDELSKKEVANIYGVTMRALTGTVTKLDRYLEADIEKMMDDLTFGLDDYDDDDEDDSFWDEDEDDLEEMEVNLFGKPQKNSGQVIDEVAKKREEKKRAKIEKK